MFIEVQHWSGAGNRFVIIDNRQNRIDHQLNNLVSSLCQRKDLPAAEGLLVLLELDRTKSSCHYDFYNPDGSTGLMCGNGARCAVQHAILTDDYFNRKKIHLILNNRSYTAKVFENDRVALQLPLYKELRLIDSWTYVNVGSHHVIIDAREIVQSIDEFTLNLNIAYLIEDQSVIHLRTYENGVFDETQACGTGAISTTIAFWTRNIIHKSKIDLIPISQRLLTVHLDIDDKENILGMILEGDARQDASPSQLDKI
jgi:diaminopimelate epimerase